MEVHRRHSMRPSQYDYSNAGTYFVTCCVQDRRCILGNIVDDLMQLNANGQIVADCWSTIPRHFQSVVLGEFVVMPNHVHGIVVIERRARRASPLRDMTLGTIVGSFKSAASKRLPDVKPLWQRGYYEHVIRNEQSLQQIREYIVSKPKQWALDRENPSNALR